MTQQQAGTLHASGEGQIRIRPDIARIHLTVLTESKTAAEAAEQNAARMGAVIERVRSLGIPEGDMRTIGLHLYPVTSYEEGPDRGKIIGYRAEDTIQVEAPVELAGRVFDEGIAAGANQSSGLSFALRDESAYRAQVLAAAVAAARRDADLVSEALGLRILGVREVHVEPGGAGRVMREAARVSAGATPVLPGELTLSARVSIVFECG